MLCGGGTFPNGAASAAWPVVDQSAVISVATQAANVVTR
jgi:hypothetical protein